MGFALYAEYVWTMLCPLCIFQRVGFIVMGVFFLLARCMRRAAGRAGFMPQASGSVRRSVFSVAAPVDPIASRRPDSVLRAAARLHVQRIPVRQGAADGLHRLRRMRRGRTDSRVAERRPGPCCGSCCLASCGDCGSPPDLARMNKLRDPSVGDVTADMSGAATLPWTPDSWQRCLAGAAEL
ncbi:disulfide bond formation protein B [Rhodanobacter lindaniclasticus]